MLVKKKKYHATVERLGDILSGDKVVCRTLTGITIVSVMAPGRTFPLGLLLIVAVFGISRKLFLFSLRVCTSR